MSDFRVLDLGAHDGFVTHFIARQARQASDVRLHIDGVEANKHGVELFNRRAREQDIPGSCLQGLVEDAPSLFKRHSYDAVVLYELIEHAPDPDALLEVAECMVRPGGRVYVSTPNGTFGTGSNPHHLWTWVIVDLVDLIRRHGRIQDVLPGEDGVSVVSYTPFAAGSPPQAEVGIYCGPGWEKWSPIDIETKGLGGSETAAVRLAEALSTFDCRVTVYGELDSGVIGQVVFRHHSSFDPMDDRKLLIVSRLPGVFDQRINATRKVLWMHDTDAGDQLTPTRAAHMDKVMCLSHWHYGHLLRKYPFLKEKLYITRNGITPQYFGGEHERNPHRAIYTSSPDRGLDLLLEMWPDVRARVPDAELVFAYATVYEAVAKANPAIRAFREQIQVLQDSTPGVVNLGSLTQPQVAVEMQKSGVWLAPSFSTPSGARFCETFCIGAVEAAAAGCKRVMAQWGALEERDEQPFDMSRWIPADRSGRPRRDLFVAAIIEAMIERTGHVKSETALELDWEEVAADFLTASFSIPEPLVLAG